MRKISILFLIIGMSWVCSANSIDEEFDGVQKKQGFIDISLGPVFQSNLEVAESVGFNISFGKLISYGKYQCSARLGFVGRLGSFLSVNKECNVFQKNAWSLGLGGSILFGAIAGVIEPVAETETELSNPVPSEWLFSGGAKADLYIRHRVSSSVDIGIRPGVISVVPFQDISEIANNILFYVDGSFRYYF